MVKDGRRIESVQKSAYVPLRETSRYLLDWYAEEIAFSEFWDPLNHPAVSESGWSWWWHCKGWLASLPKLMSERKVSGTCRVIKKQKVKVCVFYLRWFVSPLSADHCFFAMYFTILPSATKLRPNSVQELWQARSNLRARKQWGCTLPRIVDGRCPSR